MGSNPVVLKLHVFLCEKKKFLKEKMLTVCHTGIISEGQLCWYLECTIDAAIYVDFQCLGISYKAFKHSIIVQS